MSPSRTSIAEGVRAALEPLAAVYAGWDGGSAAFDALGPYSDVDLTFLVDPAAPTSEIFATAEAALESLSPIAIRYHEPPGIWEGITHRLYRLADTDEFLLVDLALLRADARDHFLDVERHGHARPLFDKGDWLRPRPVDAATLAAKAEKRLGELKAWFPMSQNFVRKSILRGQELEAIARYHAYTLRPLVDLLRMRECPLRWDFGMRYLDRDLSAETHDRLRSLIFLRDLADLQAKHSEAEAWGTARGPLTSSGPTPFGLHTRSWCASTCIGPGWTGMWGGEEIP